MSKLSNVSSYVTEKISVDSIDISEYITTDNLLQNKRGRVIAEKLPTQKVTKFKKDDILIANIRPYLKKIWQADIEGGASSDVLVIRSNDLIDNNFLYYALTQDSFFEYVMKGSKGTKMPRGDKSQIMHFVIPDFDNDEQIKIGKLLKSIDKKIQTNNQINRELEAMAKTLYDYWFVQFDFPDQNGKPYKSSGGKMVYNPELKREIPEGWGVDKLSSILEIGRETINPMKTPKEEFKYYSIPEYDVSGSFSYELGETIKSNKFLVEKSDLLVSKLNPWFNRVVYNLEESAISSTEFIVWKTINRFEKNFLYQVATSEGFIEYCTRFATGTSNSHKRVSPDIMVSFQIPFEKTYIQKFGEITDSIRTQVLQNNEQNQELIQLRDWLLPMLMNGQVKVE